MRGQEGEEACGRVQWRVRCQTGLTAQERLKDRPQDSHFEDREQPSLSKGVPGRWAPQAVCKASLHSVRLRLVTPFLL